MIAILSIINERRFKKKKKKKLAVKERLFFSVRLFPLRIIFRLCVGLVYCRTRKKTRKNVFSYKQAFTLITLGRIESLLLLLFVCLCERRSREHGACAIWELREKSDDGSGDKHQRRPRRRKVHLHTLCTTPFYSLAYRSKDREKLLEISVNF